MVVALFHVLAKCLAAFSGTRRIHSCFIAFLYIPRGHDTGFGSGVECGDQLDGQGG